MDTIFKINMTFEAQIGYFLNILLTVFKISILSSGDFYGLGPNFSLEHFSLLCHTIIKDQEFSPFAESSFLSISRF